MTNPALEAAIRADRDDPGPVLVYADWLQAQGNPIGELIVLSQGGPDKTKHARANAIIAGLELPAADLAMYGWRWGLWQWLRLENSADWMDEKFDPLALARRVFSQPMCVALDELRIGVLRWDHNYRDVPAVLEHASTYDWAAHLRRLHLGDVDDNVDMGHHVIGDVGSTISKAFPRLTSLKLHSSAQDWRGDGETFGIDHLALPALTELVIETCSLSKRRLAHVLAATLPKLEKLELWFGAEDQGADCAIADLAPLLGGATFPQLRALGLRNAEFADDIARALASSAIAARLEAIDLSMGTMTDAGAGELAANAARFTQLTTLSIDDSFLSPAAIQTVRDAFPSASVVSNAQKEADADDPDDVHRFVTVAE